LRSVTRTWHLVPHDPAAIEHLARALGTSPVVAQLLLNRQQCDADAASAFLKAPLSGLYEPERLPGMPEAVERIHAAIHEKKRIVVYGDYDVDGVSGTAILLTTLRALGADVDFHVPHRLEDGYGLSNEALRKIAEAGTSLVVTVDCGIASCAEADEARRLGLELIVTDHHEPKERLPDAAVLVHPPLARRVSVGLPVRGGRGVQAGVGLVQEGVRQRQGVGASARGTDGRGGLRLAGHGG